MAGAGTPKMTSQAPGPLPTWPLIIQQSSLDYFMAWQLDSKRKKAEAVILS